MVVERMGHDNHCGIVCNDEPVRVRDEMAAYSVSYNMLPQENIYYKNRCLRRSTLYGLPLARLQQWPQWDGDAATVLTHTITRHIEPRPCIASFMYHTRGPSICSPATPGHRALRATNSATNTSCSATSTTAAHASPELPPRRDSLVTGRGHSAARTGPAPAAVADAVVAPGRGVPITPRRAAAFVACAFVAPTSVV
jgi:hypothetical protein